MNENNNISTNTVKRTKNKKFNFIDALLIVVAVTVAATLVYVFLPSSFFKKLFSLSTNVGNSDAANNQINKKLPV